MYIFADLDSNISEVAMERDNGANGLVCARGISNGLPFSANAFNHLAELKGCG